VQSNTLQSYPAELSLTVLICAVGSALNGGVALVALRGDMSPWAIGFDTRLFTAVYSVRSLSSRMKNDGRFHELINH
jgi:hypothetical protein